jgi:hypothetical protein
LTLVILYGMMVEVRHKIDDEPPNSWFFANFLDDKPSRSNQRALIFRKGLVFYSE